MAEALYVRISDDITEHIKSGDLKEHDKLSERKLAEQYQVSRAVIRDAIKLLSEKGLVSTQAGRGSYVTIPNGQELMGKFEQAMDNSCISSEIAIEAREIIELSYIQLIAQRATDEDIADLKRIIASMQAYIIDSVSFARLDEEFHLALAGCTQNEVLKLFTGTLNTITNRDRLLATREVRKSALEEHQRLVEAVEAHDAPLLQKYMEEHLKCVRKYVITV